MVAELPCRVIRPRGVPATGAPPHRPTDPWGDDVIEAIGYLVAAVLLLNVLVALWRVLRGPTDTDRLMAVLLMGTTGVALLVLLAHLTRVPALRDAALALVALATVVVLVRVRAPGGER